MVMMCLTWFREWTQRVTVWCNVREPLPHSCLPRGSVVHPATSALLRSCSQPGVHILWGLPDSGKTTCVFEVGRIVQSRGTRYVNYLNAGLLWRSAEVVGTDPDLDLWVSRCLGLACGGALDKLPRDGETTVIIDHFDSVMGHPGVEEFVRGLANGSHVWGRFNVIVCVRSADHARTILGFHPGVGMVSPQGGIGRWRRDHIHAVVKERWWKSLDGKEWSHDGLELLISLGAACGCVGVVERMWYGGEAGLGRHKERCDAMGVAWAIGGELTRRVCPIPLIMPPAECVPSVFAVDMAIPLIAGPAECVSLTVVTPVVPVCSAVRCGPSVDERDRWQPYETTSDSGDSLCSTEDGHLRL